MDFIKTIGKYYKDKDLYLQRKAEYSLGLLAILFFIVLALTLLKLFLADIATLEIYISIANLFAFFMLFMIIYFGKLHLGVNLLCILGIVRLFMVFDMYAVMHVYLFMPILMVAVAFMHTKRYQYYFVNLTVIGVSLYRAIIGLNEYYQMDKPYEEAVLGFISLFYSLAILFVLNRIIKIVESEINQSRKLFDLSAQDHLTKTFNRRKIDRTFKTNIFSKRISILLIDFDDFKKVNDTHGHHIGDEVLSSSISLVNSVIRKDDYVVRWGGEEFVVILHECDVEQAYRIAESIRKQVEENQFDFNNKLRTTVSIGVAQKEDEESIYDAINRADKALYKAKAQGKNQTTKY